VLEVQPKKMKVPRWCPLVVQSFTPRSFTVALGGGQINARWGGSRRAQTAVLIEAVFSGLLLASRTEQNDKNLTLLPHLLDIFCVFLDILYTRLEQHSGDGCTCIELVCSRTLCVKNGRFEQTIKQGNDVQGDKGTSR
jgi:hypothetical protein